MPLSKSALPCSFGTGLRLSLALGLTYSINAYAVITYSGDVFNGGSQNALEWDLGPVDLDIGSASNAGTVTVSGSGTITLPAGGSIDIGRVAGASGTLEVSGSNARVNVGENIDVAGRGVGVLQISDGGQVTANQAYIGRQGGSQGRVVVSGAGSKYSTTGFFFVGNNGFGQMQVEAGGQVSAGGIIDIGRNPSSGPTSSALITDAGSLLSTTTSLNIARLSDSAGELTVTNQAQARSESGYLGRDARAVGEVTISAGGQWLMDYQLVVGDSGQGILNLESAGKVSSGSGSLANLAGSSGQVTMTGTGTLWSVVDQLFIGALGDASLSLADGAELVSGSAILAQGTGVTANAQLVDSRWTNEGSLLVADQGTAHITASAGSMLSSDSAVLGQGAGSSGSVQLTGAGTQWRNNGSLVLGAAGSGVLSLEQGAILRAAQVQVAAQAGASATLNLLSGGLLETSQLSKGAGTANINFNGGTLRATGNQLNFLLGFDPITLGNDGLVVDTNGYEVSISTEFAASPGKLVKQGGGTLNLIGANSFSGGTEVLAGIVQAGSAQALGTGMVTIGGAGQIAEVHMFGDVRAPQVFGGAGLPFGMLVTSQGLLTGTGVIGSTTVRSGGIISPGVLGEELATLSIDGDLIFEPGGIYEVLIDTSTGQSDLLRVRGTAVLTDGVLKHDSLGLEYELGARYEVLSAGTRVGEFADVTSDYAFLKVIADYSIDPNKVFLGFERREDVLFSDYAYTPNQKATAAALDGIGVSNDVIDFILGLDVGEPAKVYDSLSGELHATLRNSLMGWDNTLASAAMQPFNTNLQLCADDRSASPWQHSNCQTASGWSAKVQALGNWQKRRGDGNAAEGKTDTGGMLLSVEAPMFDSGWHLGALVGVGQSKLNVHERSSSAGISHYSVAVYAGKDIAVGDDQLKLKGGLAYSRHQVDSKRFVEHIDQTLKANYHADTLQAFAEVGYAIAGLGAWQLEPYAGLNVSHQRLGRFTEKGGFTGLNSHAQSANFTHSVLGLRTGYSFEVAGKSAQINTNVGWKHLWGNRDITRSMAFNVGSPDFTIAGVDQPRNSAVLGLQVQLALDERSTLELAIGGEFGQRLRQQAAQLSLRYDF